MLRKLVSILFTTALAFFVAGGLVLLLSNILLDLLVLGIITIYMRIDMDLNLCYPLLILHIMHTDTLLQKTILIC